MMLNDQDMALDALEMAKVGATELTKAASESSNPALRQTLLQMRSQCENAQQQLGNMAISNQWYLPADPAAHQEVNKVLQFFRQSAAGMTNMGNVQVNTGQNQNQTRM